MARQTGCRGPPSASIISWMRTSSDVNSSPACQQRFPRRRHYHALRSSLFVSVGGTFTSSEKTLERSRLTYRTAAVDVELLRAAILSIVNGHQPPKLIALEKRLRYNKPTLTAVVLGRRLHHASAGAGGCVPPCCVSLGEAFALDVRPAPLPVADMIYLLHIFALWGTAPPLTTTVLGTTNARQRQARRAAGASRVEAERAGR